MKKILCFVATIVSAGLLIAAAPSSAPETLYLFEQGGRYGYMDAQGNAVIRPQFKSAAQFSEDLAAVIRPGKTKTGYINSKGVFVIPDDKYYGLNSFQDGIAVVELDYRAIDKPIAQMLIDQNGKAVCDRSSWDSVSAFQDGYAVYTNLKAGIAPPPGYERAVKRSYLDTAGKPATKQMFDQAQNFSDGFAAVGRWLDGDIQFTSEDIRWAVINRDFQRVTEYRFNEIGSYHDGLIPVRIGEKWGYIDQHGQPVIDCRYDAVNLYALNRLPSYDLAQYERHSRKNIYDFSEGLAGVCQDGKWGYINTVGETVIPFQFDLARPFSEGLAAVQQNRKWGFIDKNGKLVIPPRYDHVLDCQSSLIVVADKDGDFKHYIDKSGRTVRPKLPKP